jgi:D-lactate dehydrogenase (cytochrome)
MLSASARDLLIAGLRELLGDRSSTNATQIEHHSHSESWHPAGAPDVVVFPTTTEEVSASF